MLKKLKPILISVAIALAVGGLSALLTKDNMNIYGEINTPSFAPPGWLFPIVWTILFTLMGIGSGIVYKKKDLFPAISEKGLIIYGISLIFNFLWSIIFFNMRAFLFSFIWLLVLIVLVIIYSYLFYKIDKKAGLIQIPYIIWIIFAAVLNYAIFMLN